MSNQPIDQSVQVSVPRQAFPREYWFAQAAAMPIHASPAARLASGIGSSRIPQRSLILSLIAGAAVIMGFGETCPAELKRETKEVVLGTMPPSWIRELTAISPDGKHIAYAEVEGGKGFVTIDGVRGEPVNDIIGTLTWTSGGEHLSYIAVTARGIHVVIDQHFSEPFKDVYLPVKFSSDGKHYAYGAETAKGAVLITDGKPGKTYQQVSEWTFSPDGNSVIYVATNGNREFAVTNGKEGPSFDRVIGPALNVNGASGAYFSRSGANLSFNIDGRQLGPYSDIFSQQPTFSPDGKSVSFGASLEKEIFVIVDGAHKSKCRGLINGEVVFSSDSAHFALITTDDNASQLYVDGAAKARAGKFGEQLAFSPDGKSLVYITCEKQGDPLTLTVGAKEFGPYKALSSTVFSKDSLRWAASVNRGGREAGDGYTEGGWHLLVDGKEWRTGSDFFIEDPTFSADGKHVAWSAHVGGHFVLPQHVAVGKRLPGDAGKKQHINDGRSIVVVDDQPFDDPAGDRVQPWRFAPDGTLFAVFLRNDRLVRVEGSFHAE